MTRLNSLTLTIYDTPNGVPEYEIETSFKPKVPLTPAEITLYHVMNLLESIGEGDEDHTQNETNNGHTPGALCTGLQRDLGQGVPKVGGSNVVVIGSRTERSRGTLDT